jgi:hypothetical protein
MIEKKGIGLLPMLLLVLLLQACDSKTTLFTPISPDHSGITFSNRITESDTMNILKFEYVYNGGGAAIGDFNNDGKQDIYFTGNQEANRLYLNKGDFKFDDVTAIAKVSGEGKWCSGVALVDINNDGWMDIYVGATVKKTAADRANLLYVNQGLNNQGIPTFKEVAREYGLADEGHTTNAAFLDYDNDGDLDLYVVTNTLEGYPNNYRKKVTDGSAPNTDRLYRNDWNAQLKHPVYTDVSKQAGILIEGYGLGVNITDINRDGWKDIYVTNDYVSNDLLYINNHNGTFTDQAAAYFKHTSNTAMGNDVTDINNDGLVDVIAVDMLPRNNARKKVLMAANNYHMYINNDEYGYTYEYGRNTVQLNQGNKPGTQTPVFSEISLLANVAETDWSWTPLVVDFDHDGYRDLIITNGFPKDVTDRDFMSFRAQSSSIASPEFMLKQIPEVKINNYAFHNNGDLTFTDVSADWGITQPSFSNGAAYGDLDNDGDLDYVVNNINDSAFVFRNQLMERKPEQAHYLRVLFKGSEQNRMGLGTFVELTYGNGQKQVYEHSPYRGYLSSVENAAHFGLGATKEVAQVKIIWPTGAVQLFRNVKADQVLTVDIQAAKPDSIADTQSFSPGLFTEVTDSLKITYQHEEPDFVDFNIQRLLPHKLSQYAPAIAVADVNADGLDDVFIGGSTAHKGRFMIQSASGAFIEKDLLPGKKGEEKIQEDMGVLWLDVDNDNDQDLYIASGGSEWEPNAAAYQDRLYLNNGKGSFRQDTTALPAIRTSKSCVKAADYDRDGDLDLFVGGRVEPGQYPKPVSSFIFRNDSKGSKAKFTDVTSTVATPLLHLGLVCDAIWTDYDNDGWMDLILAGEWMPLTFLKNQNGKFTAWNADAGTVINTPATNKDSGTQSITQSLSHSIGWWNSLAAGDFDRDGDMDYIAGNLGLNTLNKATEQEPVKVYAKDFDGNGSFDVIPTAFFPGTNGQKQEFTFHGREDLIKQMVVMRARFPYFKDFAQASIDKLLTEEERKTALVLKANYLQSVLVENLGKGQFRLVPLPIQAQFAPVFGIITEDMDQDGNLDILAVGNDYGNEVMIGRYDALNGIWLKGNGKNTFVPQTIAASGFYVPGNAKGLAQLSDAKGHQLVVASQNRGRLCVFKNNHNALPIRLLPDDAFAWITYADGRKEKKEFPYGSSFLSQSARELILSKGVKSVEIASFTGKKRMVAL